jgi:hypothetical protein
MAIHVLDEELIMNKQSRLSILHRRWVHCLYRNSEQIDLPVCEDEVAIQDILDFDSSSDFGYNGDLYAWKDVGDVDEDEDDELREADPCGRRFDNEMVDVTENTLGG